MCGLLFFPSVHVNIDEKITLSAERDGGIQNMEVKGAMVLQISDPQKNKVHLQVHAVESPSLQLKVFDVILKAFVQQAPTSFSIFYRPIRISIRKCFLPRAKLGFVTLKSHSQSIFLLKSCDGDFPPRKKMLCRYLV